MMARKRIRYVIANNGDNDGKIFMAAYRIGVGEIKVIGQSFQIQKIIKDMDIENKVEFLPSDFTPKEEDENLILDATKNTPE